MALRPGNSAYDAQWLRFPLAPHSRLSHIDSRLRPILAACCMTT